MQLQQLVKLFLKAFLVWEHWCNWIWSVHLLSWAMAGLGIVCLVFDNSSLDEQLLLKQQPSALCHWLIDNNRDYVGRREDVMCNC